MVCVTHEPDKKVELNLLSSPAYQHPFFVKAIHNNPTPN